jgi:hypothetical protein
VEERARREPLPSERRAVLSAATRHLARIAALALCACWAGIASAERLAPADVPEPLRPWIRWALGENDDALCPVLESRGPACAWPGRLSLDVGDAGGTFALRLQADRAELFHLPGGGEIWPEDVTVDGKPVPVVGSHDSGQPPAVRIEVGAHEIRGRFAWPRLPPVLLVPERIGLVALRLFGAPVAHPARDDRGRLWLSAGGDSAEAGEQRLELEVHRKVTDEVPLLLETRLVLQIGGAAREERLGPPLPPGFVPLSLESPLPARFDPDGRLRVQVRPGRWAIRFSARYEGPASALSLAPPAAGDAWAPQEVWVFESRPALRLVSVEGTVVDPQQTSLPAEWQSLPAYQMTPGATLKLVERRRGDAEPAPDELSLDRRWFLDFDDGGATVSDRLTGRVHARSRLEMGEGTELGRAAVNGADQFLTRLAGGTKAGVQVSPGDVTVEADSRVSGTASTLPAVGWDHDVAYLHGALELPPGYELFHASGVDRATWTWINRWSLLDLFLVGVVTVAFLRLYGLTAAALALLALVLTTTEDGAPRWVWIGVLAVEALRRAVPADRLRRTLLAARGVALAAFFVVAVPFVVTALRVGLYPSLGGPAGPSLVAQYAEDESLAAGVAVPESAPAPAPAYQAEMDKGVSRSARPRLGMERPLEDSARGGKKLEAVDPNARITTGPGVPTWSWRRVNLTWSGPVLRGETLRLWLIPPWGNACLAIARAILLGLLVAIVLGVRRPSLGLPAVPGAVVALCLLPLAAPAPARAADFPSDEMLKDLRGRLTEPAPCAPRCVEIAAMRIDAGPAGLKLSLDVSAATAAALALPGSAATWLPAIVKLDGADTSALLRGDGGTLYLRLPAGAHRVELEGPLAEAASVALPLPVVPHRAEAKLSGYTLLGLRPDGGVEPALQLVRDVPVGEEAKREAPALPPFVRVIRSFELGLTWEASTYVVRLSPVEAAVVVELPLLDGESVTTPGIEVRERRARIALPPGTESVSFRSVLATRDAIALRAPEGVPWTEVWQVRASPIWHLAHAGIPPVQAERSRPAAPDLEWMPWPGEKVDLTVQRPDGIPGATLTLDAAALALRPGVRSSDDTLMLTVRSSQGGEHRVTLPEGATLQRVAIDGVEQPLRQEGRAVVLPVRPGTAAVEIGWREADGVSLFWRGPEVDLGAPAVNVEITVQPSASRWILFLSGPPLGPAVLFWPVLAAYLGIAWVLARTRIAPLRTWQWALLAVGLTQVGVALAGVVAVWLLALGWRAEHGTRVPGRWFDLLQVALVALTLAAFYGLGQAILGGLLGMPDMQIAGNGSSAEYLRWYQDRSGAVLPRPRVVSVPLGVYRGLMLVWSFWIAAALIGWLRFGWRAFSAGELWRPLRAHRAPSSGSAP